MRYLPNGTQMREGDLYTIEHVGIPSMVLMERAAMATVCIMEEESMDLSKVLIVCGSGNNGGDGFAIARILVERGHMVTVVFVGNEKSLSEQAKAQKEILDHLHIPVIHEIPNESYSIIVDAIFGVGLSRKIEGNYANVIDKLNKMTCIKLSVDIPSGIDAGTGKVLGTAFQADYTVSYGFEKMGTVLFPGATYAGKVKAVSIGIPTKALLQYQPHIVYTYEREDLNILLPRRKANSHKGSYGKVLMITGSKGMAGAAYLSAKAAYTTGAGLVQIYTTEDNREILQQMLPEAIISTYIELELHKLEELLLWADVIAIGPGLGTGFVSEQLLIETLKRVRKPLIIDADGLNMLSNHLDLLKETLASVVLTPHMKEMSRLLHCSVKELQDDRMEKLQEFVREFPVTCVLKDARTFVMKMGQSPYLNTSGNAAMAKAGAGDVLAGIIGGILAQTSESYDSICMAVYLHGLAGDYARDKKGIYSVLARDLISSIGYIYQEIDSIADWSV